jgi:hypothetical protein
MSLGEAVKLVFSATLLILFVVSYSLSPAQLVSSEIYETEEDLQEGLESGALTFDQYLELLDMIRNKVAPASGETEKLYFIPDINSIDIHQVETQSQNIDLDLRVDSFLDTGNRTSSRIVSGKVAWRVYQKFQDDKELENSFLCEVGNGRNIIAHIETDHSADISGSWLTSGDLEVRRRYVTILLPRYSVKATLGNFDKRIGLGLNIGYHSLMGYTTQSGLNRKDSFLYPTHGRYNGLLAESRIDPVSITAFYSKNRFEQIDDRIGAVDLAWLSDNAAVGLCLSKGELKNIVSKNIQSDNCQSLHFNIKSKLLRLSGEYALLSNRKSGWAFELYSSRRKYSFDLAGWRYEDDFIHPFGGGISNADYESIYLEIIDYQYRARQAGERGVLFTSRYNLADKLDFYFLCNQWRERSYLPAKIRWKMGAGYEFSKDLSLAVYHNWSDLDTGDEASDQDITSVNLFFSPVPKLDLDLLSNYRRTENKNYGDIRFKIRAQVLPAFDFILWLKYNDPDFSHVSDEYFSFQVQERMRFFENCFVSAEFISKFYRDEDKTNTQAARVRMEISW